MPEILDYTDYRAFLRDFHQAKKRASRQWSFGVWARQLGLRSPSTLMMILSGKRNPGSRLTRSLCGYFSFDERQAEYFQNLIRIDPLKEKDSLSRALKEKMLMPKDRRGSRFLDEKTFLGISSWYHYALQQLASIGALDRTPRQLARGFVFPLSADEIEAALEALLRAGLLKKGEGGRFEAADEHLVTSQDVSSAGLRRFHAQILAKAQEALAKLAPERREISGVTFAMKRSSLPRAKALIREFEKNLCTLMEAEGEGDSIVHLEVALLPLFEEAR